jgi:hypothetical protein
MSVVIGVDPGINHCGLSVFVDGKLHGAHLIEPAVRSAGIGYRVSHAADAVARVLEAHRPRLTTAVEHRVMLEWPQVYMPGKSKGDNNDLLPLAAVDGAIAVLACHLGYNVDAVGPDDWKGGPVPKKIMFGRIVQRLEPAERELLSDQLQGVAESLKHNVVDGVGIALFALGRLQPRVAI